MPNLVGTGLNQVPTNSMLGGLAYQDPEHASIKNLDLKNLSQINSEIADTAVDVFVYDTSKDSDGGAWRKRTQNTSWYNETLGTATRGTRKEFPSVAVIVAQENPDYQVVIYDGDDPDLPMWMVFERGGNNDPFLDGSTPGSSFLGNYPPTSVSALNGIICAGAIRSSGALTNLNAGLRKFSFIEDACYATNDTNTYKLVTSFVDRNALTMTQIAQGGSIVNVNVNDVSMTVLPNAPIDDDTGLPIPTIAVATAGGVSVIKDDGTVVDITSGTIIHHEPRSVAFLGTRLLWTEGNNYDLQDRVYLNAEIPSDDIVLPHTGALPSGYIGYGIGKGATNIFNNLSLLTTLNNEPVTRQRKFQIGGPDNNIFLGCKHAVNGGLEHIHQNIESPSNGMVVTTTSSYNTGWMHGDCKGAFLSDTTAESLSANTNLAPNAIANGTNRLSSETYESGDTSWSMVDASGTANGYVKIEFTNLVVGQTYVISMDWDGNATLDAGYSHKIQHQDGTASENFTEFLHWNKTNGSSETLTGLFTAQTTNNENLVMYCNAITLNVSNFNVRAVDDEDRSVNNKGLAVTGTVTKSAVATGADLVGYGPFSTSNYLEQPYNSDLLFGTSDFCISGWHNSNSSNTNVYEDIICFGNTGKVGFASNEPGSWFIQTNKTHGWTLYYRTSGGSGHSGWTAYNAAGNFNDHSIVGTGTWYKITLVRSGYKIYSYTNDFYHGSQDVTAGSFTTSSNLSDMRLRIGWDGGTNYNYPSIYSKMALWRVSKSAPTPEQVKKMYEDEKVLFQENAKTTLYGSSDVVTALAYDDTTNLLHVGTSAGRSEFQGLRRINNTTDAVTTAISASNGLVAEQ